MAPLTVATAPVMDEQEERARRTHAAVLAAFVPTIAPPPPDPLADVPIEGFAEAEATETAVSRKVEALRGRLADAEAQVAKAGAARAALVAKAAAGEALVTTALAEVEAALRDGNALASLLRDALPGAEADLTKATAAVTSTLFAEARRIAAEAQEQADEARHVAEEARKEADALAEKAHKAQLFTGLSGSRRAWLDRIEASRRAARG